MRADKTEGRITVPNIRLRSQPIQGLSEDAASINSTNAFRNVLSLLQGILHNVVTAIKQFLREIKCLAFPCITNRQPSQKTTLELLEESLPFGLVTQHVYPGPGYTPSCQRAYFCSPDNRVIKDLISASIGGL